MDTREILHLTLIKYPSCSKNFDFYFPFFDLVRKLIFENFSDSVSAQKILLESIGIKRLSAVWATPLLPERFRLGGAGSNMCLSVYVFTFSHFHWLNVLGSSGSGNTWVVCPLSVCLSVRLCVCVSVRASMAKLPVRFQWNFPKMIPYRSIGVRLSFGSLT